MRLGVLRPPVEIIAEERGHGGGSRTSIRSRDHAAAREEGRCYGGRARRAHNVSGLINGSPELERAGRFGTSTSAQEGAETVRLSLRPRRGSLPERSRHERGHSPERTGEGDCRVATAPCSSTRSRSCRRGAGNAPPVPQNGEISRWARADTPGGSSRHSAPIGYGGGGFFAACSETTTTTELRRRLEVPPCARDEGHPC